MLRADIDAIFLGVLAALSASCGSSADHHRCSPEPIREERRVALVNASFCVVAAPAQASATASVATGSAASASASHTAAPDAPAPGGLTLAVEPSAPPPAPDPGTCEIDCLQVCQGNCRRIDAVSVECVTITGGHPCGRLTEGARPHASDGSADGALLAMHALEAISAVAFDRLALELASHGAPLWLVQGAERSAAEERRHAELLRGMLAARAIAAPAPEIEPTAERSLAEIALENAVEGCVRESWGALLAAHLALHAKDASLRSFYAAISEDEQRHADWSWALDAWCAGVLPAPDVERVREARQRATEAFA